MKLLPYLFFFFPLIAYAQQSEETTIPWIQIRHLGDGKILVGGTTQNFLDDIANLSGGIYTGDGDIPPGGSIVSVSPSTGAILTIEDNASGQAGPQMIYRSSTTTPVEFYSLSNEKLATIQTSGSIGGFFLESTVGAATSALYGYGASNYIRFNRGYGTTLNSGTTMAITSSYGGSWKDLGNNWGHYFGPNRAYIVTDQYAEMQIARYGGTIDNQTDVASNEVIARRVYRTRHSGSNQYMAQLDMIGDGTSGSGHMMAKYVITLRGEDSNPIPANHTAFWGSNRSVQLYGYSTPTAMTAASLSKTESGYNLSLATDGTVIATPGGGGGDGNGIYSADGNMPTRLITQTGNLTWNAGLTTGVLHKYVSSNDFQTYVEYGRGTASSFSIRDNDTNWSVDVESGALELKGSEILIGGRFIPHMGTTAQRPPVDRVGELFFNTSTNSLQFSDGTTWSDVGGGSGGGSDQTLAVSATNPGALTISGAGGNTVNVHTTGLNNPDYAASQGSTVTIDWESQSTGIAKVNISSVSTGFTLAQANVFSGVGRAAYLIHFHSNDTDAVTVTLPTGFQDEEGNVLSSIIIPSGTGGKWLTYYKSGTKFYTNE